MRAADAALGVVEALQHHNARGVVQLASPDIVSFTPELRESTGGQALAAWLAELERQFPGFSIECRRILVAEPAAAVDSVLHSSVIGDLRLMGAELASREVEVTQPMLITMRLSEGRVSVLHAYYDRLRVLEELGIFGDVEPAGVIDLPASDATVDERAPTTDAGLSSMFYRLINEGSVDQYVAAHMSACRYVAPVGNFPGQAGVREYMKGFYAAFSEVHQQGVGDVMAGNMVASEWRFDGRHTGDIRFPGGAIQATGRGFTLHGASLLVVDAGMIHSHRLYYDRLEMLGDLGLVPA